jgi:hypothetical protein
MKSSSGSLCTDLRGSARIVGVVRLILMICLVWIIIFARTNLLKSTLNRTIIFEALIR